MILRGFVVSSILTPKNITTKDTKKVTTQKRHETHETKPYAFFFVIFEPFSGFREFRGVPRPQPRQGRRRSRSVGMNRWVRAM